MQQLSNGEVQKKSLAHIYVAPNAKSCVTEQSVWCTLSENESLCCKGWYGDFVSVELKSEVSYMVDTTCMLMPESCD